mgnify:FL=1|jgi:hypothetical protein|tara:strand:- start:2429 stop:3016 length:588 start_codon:yes stop_codon:yes gene_type:complete
MKVKDFSENVYKVCEMELSNNNSSPLWGIIWDKNISKDLLTKRSGRCYFIVVGNEIYKIGYSDCKGGIKRTIDTYRSQGNSGSPSDRTYGVHMYITEELLKGKKVEVYFQSTEEIEVGVKLANGKNIKMLTSISGKNLEVENIKLYKEMKGGLPLWNTQESNIKYPKYIIDGRIDLIKNKKRVTIEEVKERIGIL